MLGYNRTLGSLGCYLSLNIILPRQRKGHQDPNMSNYWPPYRPRQCFHMSVRVLMVLVLVFGGGFGWVVHRARVQREAVAAIERAGGAVGYDETFLGPSSRVPSQARLEGMACRPPRYRLLRERQECPL